MASMDADGSGEVSSSDCLPSVPAAGRLTVAPLRVQVDLEEFVRWSQKARVAGLGLFGGLFSDPRSLSDDYVKLEVHVRRERKEAAARAAAAIRIQTEMEAATYEAGLKLRAFAEYEKTTAGRPTAPAAAFAPAAALPSPGRASAAKRPEQRPVGDRPPLVLGARRESAGGPQQQEGAGGKAPLLPGLSWGSPGRIDERTRVGDEKAATRRRWGDFESWYIESFCRREGDDAASSFFEGTPNRQQ